LPAASGRKMHFTGITILKLKDGKIIEENGLDDGVTALTQLGLLRTQQRFEPMRELRPRFTRDDLTARIGVCRRRVAAIVGRWKRGATALAMSVR
jgi:hypothetical protein